MVKPWADLAPRWSGVGSTWPTIFEAARYDVGPTVTIGGVDYTGNAVGLVSIRRGRDTVYSQVQAGYATVELLDVDGMIQPKVGRTFTVRANDTRGNPVILFTGRVSDWSAEPQPANGGVIARYAVQAVGPIARLNRRTVLFDGRAVEKDGERVAAAVLAGLSSAWEEVSRTLTFDEVGDQWGSFDAVDASLIDTGVFDVAALDATAGGYRALDVAQEAASSGEGVLFETADGRIGYADSDRRFAAALADDFQEIPFGQAAVDALAVSQQFADVTNRVTVEYSSGVVTETSDESVELFGEVLASRLTTTLADESAALQRATTFLERHADRTRQIGRVPFNLRGVAADLRELLLTLNTGSPIVLTGVPSKLGFTHFSGFVEGVDFRVGEFDFEMGLLVSEEALSTGAVRWSLVPRSVSWDDVDPLLEWQDARVL